MKISNKLFNEQQVGRFSKQMENIQKIQDKISSGKNIIFASDNPVDAVELSALNDTQNKITQFIDNTDLALNRLKLMDSTLEASKNVFIRCNELAIQASNDILSSGDREAIALEFDELKKEFSEDVLKESGLFYFDENKKIFVDRFRNRLIFPIKNIVGKFIGLGGRIIEDKDYLAKYINSPETTFFKKGSNLYNLDLARKLSNKLDHIFLVEGYMDVVGLSKNGVENVVANLGTSLTDKQILTLNQFFDDIIICFDGDESGYKAALRAAENSIKELKPEKQISFLFLPDKEDPDSFVNKNGKKFFLDFTKQNKLPIHQFIFSHYKKQTKNNPSSMAIFEKKLDQ